ncbi:hypothetical protein B0H16DRAFT_1558497 [Mycena metata]|uniref:MYND-type domain-containing protein n=1 Tax=Mycena metata TaxID=1033252 RepID=A0AAD7N5I5_9AGAR|nr:hypothetical protein B0H16DRAFT_1558497 [Mycena metata]
MPLEITTRVIKMDELQPCDSKIGMTVVHLPYAPIYQEGYGRMDASTPVLGLATSYVAVCVCVVFHCATTGRTVLTHSPPMMDSMKNFVPIIDWVIGGDGETHWSDSDLEKWLSGKGAKKAGATVDIVVLGGSSYESPQHPTWPLLNRWMSDFRLALIVASCLDAPEVLKCASVLVDKATARITYLKLESGSPFSLITIKNPHLVKQYSEAQQEQDRLVGVTLLQRIPPENVNLHLQYNVVSHGGAIPLPDEIRQLLRFMPASPGGQSLLAQRIRPFVERSIRAGRPCELCGDIGHLKCSSCKGAWYYGKEHQLKDWTLHKVWCKSHKLASSN